jgi:arginine decarboxylase
LDYVHISGEELKAAYRDKLAKSNLSDLQRQDYEEELIAGLTSYTYLEK